MSAVSEHPRPLGRRAASPAGAPEVPGYLVSDALGAGGTASVWAASRASDGQPVALKIVPADGLAVEAAEREAAILHSLQIDHLVSVQETLRVGDSLVLVLDLLRGGTLGGVVAARGRLSAGECVTVLAPLASALGSLHRAGIIHGDLAPGNVLFDLDGRPHIADLGEARLLGELSHDPGASVGFIAPEILFSRNALPESDTYALGALGWFCLTGAAPAPGPERGPAPQLETPEADALLSVCEAALAADPSDRPALDDFALDIYECAPAAPLRMLAAGDAQGLTRRIRELAAASGRDPGTSAATSSQRRRPRIAISASWRSWLSTAAIAALVLAGVALVFLTLILVGGKAAGTSGGESSAAAASAAATHQPVADPPPTLEVEPTPSTAPSVLPSSQPSVRPASPPAQAPSVRPSTTPSAAAQRNDPLTSAAPLRDARAVVQALAQRRAALWSEPTSGNLADLDAPGSRAWAEDARTRAADAKAHVRLSGLSFTVKQTDVITSDAQRASVRTQLQTSAHQRSSDGQTRAVPESLDPPIILDLIRTSDGWRVEAVRAP